MPKEAAAKDTFTSESKRVLYIYATLASGTLGTFGVLHLLFENQLLGGLEIAGSLSILLTIGGLRLTGNVRLVRALLLLCMLIMLLVMLLTGGTERTGIFWMFVFPVSAFFLTNKRTGLWWMFGLAGIIIATMALAAFSLVLTPYSIVELRQLLISLVVVSFGIYVYQQSREHLVQETRKSDVSSREEKLRADIIVDNIEEGVVAVDTNGQVLRVNRAAENMLGWTSKELIGKMFVDLISLVDKHGHIVPRDKRPLLKTLLTGERVQIEAIYLRKDKSPLHVALTNRAVVIDGKTHGALSTFRDITQENAIDRAKSEFVTLASHQLRTPISAIAWVSELLMHGDAGKLKREQMDYIQQIYHSNKRMAALVDAMLTASSLELNSLPVRPELTDLQKLNREVLQARLDTVPANKILHIKEYYDPALRPVLFDPNITKIILQNLISNAFKYTPSGGKVTIKIKPENNFIVIEVADTGLGIPKKQQSRIFSRLFRAENVKNKDTDGTGLGLYIVKTATEYVGGHIAFSSEENQGSTFHVYLPLEGMSAKEGEADHSGLSLQTVKARG